MNICEPGNVYIFVMNSRHFALSLLYINDVNQWTTYTTGLYIYKPQMTVRVSGWVKVRVVKW